MKICELTLTLIVISTLFTFLTPPAVEMLRSLTRLKIPSVSLGASAAVSVACFTILIGLAATYKKADPNNKYVIDCNGKTETVVSSAFKLCTPDRGIGRNESV